MYVRQIRCDLCGKVGSEGTRRDYAWLLRNNLGLEGWLNEGAFDYCPDCRPKKDE